MVHFLWLLIAFLAGFLIYHFTKKKDKVNLPGTNREKGSHSDSLPMDYEPTEGGKRT